MVGSVSVSMMLRFMVYGIFYLPWLGQWVCQWCWGSWCTVSSTYHGWVSECVNDAEVHGVRYLLLTMVGSVSVSMMLRFMVYGIFYLPWLGQWVCQWCWDSWCTVSSGYVAPWTSCCSAGRGSLGWTGRSTTGRQYTPTHLLPTCTDMIQISASNYQEAFRIWGRSDDNIWVNEEIKLCRSNDIFILFESILTVQSFWPIIL